jgi:hypothetical protein
LNKEKVISILQRSTVYEGNCWVFRGCNSHGYGQIRYLNRNYSTHRLSAHIYHGLDLESIDLKALHKPECEYKACWNPAHLYIGTQKENVNDSVEANTFTGWQASALARTRKVICKHGHEFTPENTYITPQGKRRCKACHRVREYNRNQDKKS